MMVAWLSTPSAIAGAQVGLEPQPQRHDELLPIDMSWRVKLGDDMTWAEPTFDDTDWARASGTWFRASPVEEPFETVAWFRTRIRIPTELTDRELQLGISHVGAAEVFLDGARVLQRGSIQTARTGGRTPTELMPAKPVPVRFETAGDHVVAVRLATTCSAQLARIGGRSGFGLYLGGAEAFESYARAGRRRLAVHLWFSGAALSTGTLFLLIFWFRRSHRENFYFACASYALAGVAIGILGTFSAPDVAQHIAYLSLFRPSTVWASFAFLRFVQEVLFSDRPRRNYLYLAIAVTLTAGVLWIHVAVYYAFSIFLLLDVAMVLAMGLAMRRPGAGLIALGGFVGAGGAIVQMLPPLFGYEPFEAAYVYGFVINLLVISYLLAQNYARVQHDLEGQMVRAVEQERRAREEELARRSLEAANARQEVELEEARKREEVLAQLEAAHRELKSTQSQLVQSGKMAALGQLVAGVAHELNTPIGAIGSVHQSLRSALTKLESELSQQAPDVLSPKSRVAKSIAVIRDAESVIGSGSDRVSEIVKRLRTFARLDEAEFKLVDVTDGLRDTMMLIRHKQKRGIEIETRFAELPRIPCFPSPLNQVFLNLMVNAAQAIEAKPEARGTILLQTGLEPGWITIRVSDDGIGIPEENRERIFDPGFTTKGVRVGTGLGLSISFQIVQDHQGEISVQSEVGKGTTFAVRIPTNLDQRLGRRPEA